MPNSNPGLSNYDQYVLWKEVLGKQHYPYNSSATFSKDATEDDVRESVMEFLRSDEADRQRVWFKLLADAGLGEQQTFPYTLLNLSEEEIRADANFKIRNAAEVAQRSKDDALSPAYKDAIIRLEADMRLADFERDRNKRLGNWNASWPASHNHAVERKRKQLARLLIENEQRRKWEEAQEASSQEDGQTFSPPPELEFGLGDLAHLLHPLTPYDRTYVGSINEEEGTVELLEAHEDVVALTKAVTALWEWSQTQALQLQDAHREIRDLLEQRTQTSLLQSRNAWLYNRATSSSDSFEKIRRELDLIAAKRNWMPIGTQEGVRKAVKSYAADAGLPQVERQKPRKESN